MTNTNENELDINSGEVIPSILDLPDHFMISVFKSIELKQRLIYERVCKKWQRWLMDGSLWTNIDMKSYRNELNLHNLSELIKKYGSCSTKSLSLCGNYSFDNKYQNLLQNLSIRNEDTNESTKDRSREELFYLDMNFLVNNLSLKCTNLTTVLFEYLNLTQIKFKMFLSFKNLTEFSLKWCEIDSNWFELEKTESNQFSNIKCLHLIRTGRLNKTDIENICKQMPNLVILSISQSQSTLRDDSVEIIAKYLNRLQELDLTNTLISDSAIITICQSYNLCKHLTRLNLSMSSSLSNSCLEKIAENLKNLRILYLTSCFGISNLRLLQNLNQLSYLNINNTSIDKEIINEFLLKFPKCEVEYGHQKMLNRKLMWTINGSRNCVCSF